MEDNILAALALTLFAGLATGIGSLVAYFIPKPDLRYLSLSLGFAAGVMIYVGFVDLFCSSKPSWDSAMPIFSFSAGLSSSICSTISFHIFTWMDRWILSATVFTGAG